MGGKRNERQAEKAEREASKKNEMDSKAAKAAEDDYWGDDGAGKGKGSKKKEDEEAKRAEKAAAKAAKKAIEEEEAAAVAKSKGQKAGVSKVTHHQLLTQKQIEARAQAQMMSEKEMETRREMREEDYGALVDAENVNRIAAEDGAATSVEGALAMLGVKDKEDRHPEKRMKAAWKEYEATNTPLLKQEKPGLKMSQYREMLWKMWQKAPENPINAAKQ
mmetsp:Transcript_13303/g.38648  ORF Transcript_13303/g.38648 Transcript_13303/m.38648 type:complete len:219 (-) Transcript_13303:304-960(-)